MICKRTKLLCAVTFCTSENYKIKLTVIIYVETLWEPPRSDKAFIFVLFLEFRGRRKQGARLWRMTGRDCPALNGDRTLTERVNDNHTFGFKM